MRPHGKYQLAAVGLILALATTGFAQTGYFPPGDPKAGGIRDLMLIYLSKEHWTKDEFRPYVAYLGKDKKPKDWFYDSYLFLQYGGAPSGTTYISGTSIKSDWDAYFDLLFKKGQSLHALEQCIRDLEKPLGPYPKKVPIILMIPYPSAKQKDFGDVDGDGKSEDLSVHEDRCKAMRWCVGELLRRWKEARLTQFRLWGFYWMNEGIGPADEGIVKATADHIHKAGYGLHWIPWFNAPGVDRCDRLGIDFTIMQPNYAFMARHGRRADEQRLADTAYLAKQYHMGIEIEMPGQGISEQDERDNLLDYLSHGRDCMGGYMRNAVHGYYQGTDAIAKLCHSDIPADRALYDALYEFAKGKLEGRRITLSSGCRYQITGDTSATYPDDGKKLTDGQWATDEGRLSRAVGVTGDGAQITLDLGMVRRIGGVDLRLVAHKDGRTAFPRSIDVATSTDRQNWQPAGQMYRAPSSETDTLRAGFMAHDLDARDARYVLLTLHQDGGKTSLMDELVVRRAKSLTEGARYALSPLPQAPDVTGFCLTDGVYAAPKDTGNTSLVWSKQATIVVQLPGAQHVGLVRVHSPQGSPEEQVQVSTRPNAAAPWHSSGTGRRLNGSRFDVDADAVLAGEIKILLSPGIRVDEIEVYPAQSLAKGKPYTLDPVHPPKYGDADGGELTDGVLCEKGFGDKRTVGWSHVAPEVIFDLREKQKIDAVRAHVEGGGYASVGFPKRIDVLVSEDGRSWSWASTIKGPPEELLADRPAGGHHMQIGWMGGKSEPVETRFVMLRFVPGGYWTMISEVEILSNGRNVACQATYQLRPLPTSSEKYADTTGKLTDGILTTSSFGQGRAVGWSKDRPSITLDLGSPTVITTVSAHVLGGGPAGVWFPEKMSVVISTDAKEWRDAGSTIEHPPETGKDAARGYMAVSVDPVQCRFVRLTFDRRGWCMVDEIEVFGPQNGKGK